MKDNRLSFENWKDPAESETNDICVTKMLIVITVIVRRPTLMLLHSWCDADSDNSDSETSYPQAASLLVWWIVRSHPTSSTPLTPSRRRALAASQSNGRSCLALSTHGYGFHIQSPAYVTTTMLVLCFDKSQPQCWSCALISPSDLALLQTVAHWCNLHQMYLWPLLYHYVLTYLSTV